MDVEWLIKTGPCMKYLAGQAIPRFINSSPPERAMYLLLGGRVDVFKTNKKGELIPIGRVTIYGVFGGMEFFFDDGNQVYIAQTDSFVYAITEKSFDMLAREKPDVVLEILRSAYMGYDSVPPEPVPEPIIKIHGDPDKPKLPALVADNCSIFPPGHLGYPGITRPDFVSILFQKEYLCPFCKRKFTDFKVARSKLYQSAPIRFDMRRFYRNFQTEWYDIITCQHCYFSAYYNYFEEPKPLLKQKFEKELIDARASLILDFYCDRDIDFVFAQHYLAIICGTGYISTAKQIIAKTWAALSWLYEDVGDRNMEAMAAENAAAAYEEMYMSSPLTPTQEQVVCLTIAGMRYRAGLFDNIKKFLFTAKTIKSGDKAYTKMAEDMVELLREKEGG